MVVSGLQGVAERNVIDMVIIYLEGSIGPVIVVRVGPIACWLHIAMRNGSLMVMVSGDGYDIVGEDRDIHYILVGVGERRVVVYVYAFYILLDRLAVVFFWLDLDGLGVYISLLQFGALEEDGTLGGV
jgi:hypothetical protein